MLLHQAVLVGGGWTGDERLDGLPSSVTTLVPRWLMFSPHHSTQNICCYCLSSNLKDLDETFLAAGQTGTLAILSLELSPRSVFFLLFFSSWSSFLCLFGLSCSLIFFHKPCYTWCLLHPDLPLPAISPPKLLPSEQPRSLLLLVRD